MKEEIDDMPTNETKCDDDDTDCDDSAAAAGRGSVSGAFFALWAAASWIMISF